MIAWVMGLGFAAWAKIALVAAAVAVVGGLVWQFDARGTKIAELKNSLKIANANVDVMEQTVKIRDVTLLEIAKRLRGQDTELKHLCKIMKEIDNVDENDPNADPIGNALDGLQQKSNAINKTDKLETSQ